MEHYPLTEEEASLLDDLIQDASLDILDPYYQPLRTKIELYLQSGYLPHEVQGELCLSNRDFDLFMFRVPTDWWESNSAAAAKHIGRKRAGLLTSPNPKDLEMLQALDIRFSPKHININPTNKDVALSEEEKEKIMKFFPTTLPTPIPATTAPTTTSTPTSTPAPKESE